MTGEEEQQELPFLVVGLTFALEFGELIGFVSGAFIEASTDLLRLLDTMTTSRVDVVARADFFLATLVALHFTPVSQ